MSEGRKKEERMDGRLVVSPHLTDKETESIAMSHSTEWQSRPGFHGAHCALSLTTGQKSRNHPLEMSAAQILPSDGAPNSPTL